MKGNANALPTTSTVSLTKGAWFLFPLGDVVIRAWVSSLSGMERIYLDGELVSEHRSAGLDSRHTVHANGEEFTITFKTQSLLNGQLECCLSRDGNPIKCYHTEYQAAKRTSSTWRWLLIAIGIVTGAVVAPQGGALWMMVSLFVVLGMIGAAIAMKKGRFVVHEIEG